ncbi:MAG: glycoside hydrolase family 28 protein [Bacteroidales bacterium]|nr:glycoside hydrolase family 28 protein [Bacteroidales bacterium]
MKRFYFLCAALALLPCLPGCKEQGICLPREAEEILEYIQEPVFAESDYNILGYGAVADGVTDSHDAIIAAIKACSDNGGGRVIVPAGKFYTRTSIILESNVDLHLEEGSEIIFSKDPKDYLPPVLTTWEGTELFNYCPLVYAYHLTNVAITGKGTLNGNATEGFATMRPQGSRMQSDIRQMGIDQVPVKDRYFGEDSILPPNMIQFFGCRNILVEGITVEDSPFWTIHPVFCDNVTVRGVTINSLNRNNDGCDPEYTTNVLIEDCVFNTGDDSIAIKAGRDQDAWRIGQKTRNIVIRNCDFNSICNGLCIGSEMGAGVENVFMYNVRIGKCGNGIYFKSNLDRGGFIRHVWVKDITCDKVSAAIRFETNYHGARGGFYPAAFSDFQIQDVTCKEAVNFGFYAVGIDGHPLKDICLKNVTIEKAAIPYVLKNTNSITFDNVTINNELQPEVPQETEVPQFDFRNMPRPTREMTREEWMEQGPMAGIPAM